MVCRSTPGNSAITTFARLTSGVDDVQVLSMFHEQRSNAPENSLTPTDQERQSFLRAVRARVQADSSLSPSRRASICERLTAAESQPLDARTYYAWRSIEDRAVRARAALDTQFRDIADRHGVEPSDVEAVFRQVSDRNREQGRNAPDGPENPSFDTAGLPSDRATRYALEALRRRGTAITNPAVLAQAEAAWRLDDQDENHERAARAEVIQSERIREERRARRRAAAQQDTVAADSPFAVRPTGVGPDRQHCPNCGQFIGNGHTCDRPAPDAVPHPGVLQTVTGAYGPMYRTTDGEIHATVADAHEHLANRHRLPLTAFRNVNPTPTASGDFGPAGPPSTPDPASRPAAARSNRPVDAPAGPPAGMRALGLIEARDRVHSERNEFSGLRTFRTSDGMTFTSNIEAINHERRTQFAPAPATPPSLAEVAQAVRDRSGNGGEFYSMDGRAHSTLVSAVQRDRQLMNCPDCGQFQGDNHTCAVSTVDSAPVTASTPGALHSEGEYFLPSNNPTPEGYEDAEREAAIGGEDDNSPQTRLGRLLDADDIFVDPTPTTPRSLASDEALAELRRRLAGDPAPTPSAAPARVAHAPRVRQRTATRSYDADDGSGSVRMTNVSQIRQDLRQASSTTEQVVVTLNEESAAFGARSYIVSGDVEITNTGRRRSVNRDRYEVANASERSLRCTCPQYRANYYCSHLRAAREHIQAWVNQRQPVATAPAEAVADVRAALHSDYEDSLVSQQTARADFAATSDDVSYLDDMEAFQTAWDEAKQRIENGDNRIPFMTGPNVTNGLGARVGGRSFGLEIEIDFPDDVSYEAKHRVAREMYEAGLSQHRQVLGWHHFGRGRRGGEYTDEANNWTVQFDRSVDGLDGARGCEIVSPILYDEPQTWENVRKVCEIVERNGGRATPRTGLHVNVGAADFNHTVENHNRLLRLSESYEDVLIRMSHNPESGPRHRGRSYCMPNSVPASGYRSIRSAQVNNGHRSLINLDHVPAEGAPVTGSTRVEVRVFDGTVDPGRMQADVKIALGMVNAATRGVEANPVNESAGTHRSRNVGSNGRMRRLTGDAWKQDTESARRFMDSLFSRREDKAQATALFAASRWQAQ